MNIYNYINDLDITLGETKRMNCPICNGYNTFTVTNNMGNRVWNCYKVSCNAKGNAKYHLKECLELEHSVCSKCATHTKKFTTLDGKKPTIGSGIAGVIYAWSKDTEFDDSYIFMKVSILYPIQINYTPVWCVGMCSSVMVQ